MFRGMLPTDLFRIQWVSDARLSPDGHLIAVTVMRLNEEADDYRSAVWVVQADGATSSEGLYTAHPVHYHSFPSWVRLLAHS
jgi:dipeptidyl aminopeptidase/acylaminoacyl peptidase